MTNALTIAARGKGMRGAMKRAVTLQQRYGMTNAAMDAALARVTRVLQEHDARATFPITAVVLERSKAVIEKYQSPRVEFAAHGYYHVDSSALSFEQQCAHFARARELFLARGITCDGFRGPYLRSSTETLRALAAAGFLYDSSQGLAWNVAAPMETPAYQHVLNFYGALSAETFPALPWSEQGLIRIPYCLPDDEALVERLQLARPSSMIDIWLALLERTHARGELCALGLHPERAAHCESALRETLRAARGASARIWFARLDEIARWWRERANARLTMQSSAQDELRVQVEGPSGTTLLARNVMLLSPSTTAYGSYRRAVGNTMTLRAAVRPFIGVSPRSAASLASFLRAQGYIVETASEPSCYTMHLDCPAFASKDELPLLEKIEAGTFPLLRMGRWYDGAQSALCVTGDIDALSIWDYGLRLLGR